jgi:ABC-2 type transport system ATP-binding protein
MNEIILTENLTRNFRRLTAVNNLSLSVRKGEIYGFLGLNGAGKTTTIRMLLGLIRPASGSAYIKGKKVTAGSYGIWKDVGNLVEIPYSYPDLTVFENLDIIRRLRQVNNMDAGAAEDIIEKLGLKRYRNIKVKNLSHGNAQRLGLARALIHNPEILILDEPSNGLDPAGIVEIRDMLTDLAINKGVTIFISSHILGEIAKFTTRIGIIHEGRLILESTTAELEVLRKKSLVISTSDPDMAFSLLKEKGYKEIVYENDIMRITDKPALEDPAGLGEFIFNSEIRISELKTEREDLESFFLRMIKLKGGPQ